MSGSRWLNRPHIGLIRRPTVTKFGALPAIAKGPQAIELRALLRSLFWWLEALPLRRATTDVYRPNIDVDLQQADPEKDKPEQHAENGSSVPATR